MTESLLSEFPGRSPLPPHPKITLIQDEEALYRQTGSRRVMAKQLDKIIKTLKLKAIELYLLPRHTVQQAPLGYNFNLYDDLLAQMETACGHVFVTDPDTIALLGRWFDKIKELAVTENAAIRIVARAKRSYEEG